jgi:hypothetical protein
MVRLLKQVVNEAEGEKNTGGVAFSPAQPQAVETVFSRVGYVEDFFATRTKLGSFSEIPEAAQNFRQQGRRERDD